MSQPTFKPAQTRLTCGLSKLTLVQPTFLKKKMNFSQPNATQTLVSGGQLGRLMVWNLF